MSDASQKEKQVFVWDEGEARWLFCGPLKSRREWSRAVAQFVGNELEYADDLATIRVPDGEEVRFPVTLKIKDMTDAEVAALPDN